MPFQPSSLARRLPPPSQLLPLLMANLLPVVGLVAFGWRLADVMILFWLENGVIGIFTIARILTAGIRHPAQVLLRLPLAAFFCVHYGIFWFVHGVFVMAMFTGNGMMDTTDPFERPAVQFQDTFLWINLLALFASHGLAFVQTYLLTGQFRTATPPAEMAKPYPRLVVLHVAILLGGVAVVLLGQPAVAVLLLILLKIGLDVLTLPATAAVTAAPASAVLGSESPPTPR
jgi:hypothetical protein